MRLGMAGRTFDQRHQDQDGAKHLNGARHSGASSFHSAAETIEVSHDAARRDAQCRWRLVRLILIRLLFWPTQTRHMRRPQSSPTHNFRINRSIQLRSNGAKEADRR